MNDLQIVTENKILVIGRGQTWGQVQTNVINYLWEIQTWLMISTNRNHGVCVRNNKNVKMDRKNTVIGKKLGIMVNNKFKMCDTN